MNLLTRLTILTSIFAGTLATLYAANDPYIAYIYPAGGQQGTTFKIITAGQHLRGVNTVYFNGTGINATIIDYKGPGGKLNVLQEEELKRQLEEIRKKRLAEMRAGKFTPVPVPAPAPAQPANPPTNPPVTAPVIPPAVQIANPPTATPPPVTLPDLPELRNLDQMTLKQLQQVADMFLNRQKRPKPPMDEEVTLEVAIDADAAVGNRELRLRTAAGMTNPIVFQVSNLPEIREPGEYDTPLTAPLTAPTVLNGQIMPGEVDKYNLQLKAGQKLVMAAQARNLIPYLADAVPGWMQAIITISDDNGKELAFADDNGFDPDPCMYFQVPQDGEYTLKIRDSIYRGRRDFVYRVYIAEQPAIQVLFPTGSRVGMSMNNAPADWEIPAKPPVTDVQFPDLPRIAELEPNDTAVKAQAITLPQVINGCINSSNDMDYYKFNGNAGDVVVAAVYAWQYGSLLDSLLRLTDASGKVIAMNDDFENKELGLMTHHADSYLTAKLPAAGTYYVQISDAERHGGELYTYSLRVSPPQPDFSLFISPSCVNIPPGRPGIITISALRKDGWDGDIGIVLKDAPDGFALTGATIPRGKDSVRMTLTAPDKKSDQPININLEGRAQVGNKIITRPVIAADKMMQAFAYTHLVPAQQLVVAIAAGRGRVITLKNPERLQIPAGGNAKTTIIVQPAISPIIPIHIELTDPPAGVTLLDARNTTDGIILTIAADDKHTGFTDNLIAEMFTEVDVTNKKTGVTKKQRVSLGVLPAIPFEIVKPLGN